MNDKHVETLLVPSDLTRAAAGDAVGIIISLGDSISDLERLVVGKDDIDYAHDIAIALGVPFEVNDNYEFEWHLESKNCIVYSGWS